MAGLLPSRSSSLSTVSASLAPGQSFELEEVLEVEGKNTKTWVLLVSLHDFCRLKHLSHWNLFAELPGGMWSLKPSGWWLILHPEKVLANFCGKEKPNHLAKWHLSWLHVDPPGPWLCCSFVPHNGYGQCACSSHGRLGRKKKFTDHTVDGSEIRNNLLVEVGSWSYYLQGFIHPRWRRISSINSIL